MRKISNGPCDKKAQEVGIYSIFMQEKEQVLLSFVIFAL